VIIVLVSTLLFGCILTADIAGDAVGLEAALKYPAMLVVFGLASRLSVTAMKYRNYMQGE
jgi:hypothetical protein